MLSPTELFKGRKAASRVVAVIGGGAPESDDLPDDSQPEPPPVTPQPSLFPQASALADSLPPDADAPVSRRAFARRRG